MQKGHRPPMPKLPREFDVPMLHPENDFKHAPMRCLGCYLPLIGATAANSNVAPTAGSIALCWECGNLQMFGDPPDHYVPLTDQVMTDIAGWPVMVLASELRGVSTERNALLKSGDLTAFKDQQFARRAAAIVRKMRIALDVQEKEDSK